MMKFIHVTDIHIMGRTPKYRKDDFLQTALNKVKWVQDYAYNVGATAILCTGDLFDRADTAYSVLNDLMPIMQESKVPWVSIIGNHDEYGYNPETIERTPMGTLYKSGVLNHVSYDNPLEFHPANTNVEGVVITGCDSTIQTDNREDKEFDYGIVDGSEICKTIHNKDAITTIHLSHGFLANKDWGDKIHHTRIEEIYDKVKADIVLCGHEHHGFGVIETLNGKIFVNPGALCRITAGVGDINRNVNIAEISIINNWTHYGHEKIVDVKLVPVLIAEDADVVIDIEKAKAEKERSQMLNSFSETIKSVDIQSTTLNPFEAIDAVAEQVFESLGVPPELFNTVTNEAKRALQEAHEKIGGDF